MDASPSPASPDPIATANSAPKFRWTWARVAWLIVLLGFLALPAVWLLPSMFVGRDRVMVLHTGQWTPGQPLLLPVYVATVQGTPVKRAWVIVNGQHDRRSRWRRKVSPAAMDCAGYACRPSWRWIWFA